MGIKNAVFERFKQICESRNMKLNELAVRSGVTPSTVYSMFDEKRKDVSIITIKNYVMVWICLSVSFSAVIYLILLSRK